MPRIARSETRRWRWIVWLYTLVAGAAALTVYTMTAHRTIDWWFGSSYSLAAVTFGVHSPPGSLLLTLLGWAAAQPPVNLPAAFQLNLFAGVMGAVTCCLVLLLGRNLLRHRTGAGFFTDAGSVIMSLTGLAAGSLYFAFAETIWRYSVIFMPYILTALFTILILWALFIWWRRETGGRGAAPAEESLCLLMFLFGLDLSVHRTNLLMLPGFLLWVLIYRPAVYRKGSSWLAGSVGLLAGLAFHLLLMPMAARDPALNIGDPSNWRRFYEYISLQQYGGGWLVNMWPRQGSFGYQIGSYLQSLRDNLFGFDVGLTTLPLVLFVIGTVAVGRRDRRLLAGLLMLFLFASLGAVIFFNVPEGYIFPMARHYIPSFVIFGLLLSVGAGSILRSIWAWRSRIRLAALLPVLVVVLWLPVKQIERNYRDLDGSRNFFAYDFADNILRTVGPDAIVVIQGDNYWPVYYMQAVEGMRPDVAVLSESLLNLPWYVEQISRHYPDLPMRLTEEEITELAPVPWRDTTIATAVEGNDDVYRLRGSGSSGMVSLPDSLTITVPPSVPQGMLFVGDRVILDMIEENRWRRPIYFTIPPERLRDHLRLEGLVWLLVPQEKAALNADLLRENLLEHYYYRGYADPSVAMDSIYTPGVGMNLQIAFYYLAAHERERENGEVCRETIRRLHELVPFDRIEPQPSVREAIEGLCP